MRGCRDESSRPLWAAPLHVLVWKQVCACGGHRVLAQSYITSRRDPDKESTMLQTYRLHGLVHTKTAIYCFHKNDFPTFISLPSCTWGPGGTIRFREGDECREFYLAAFLGLPGLYHHVVDTIQLLREPVDTHLWNSRIVTMVSIVHSTDKEIFYSKN